MKFKYYALFSLFFIIAVYIGAYTITDTQEYSAFGMSLHIAVWIVLILVVFFVYSSLFFAYSWVRSLIVRRNNYEDLDSLISQVLFQATQNAHPQNTYPTIDEIHSSTQDAKSANTAQEKTAGQIVQSSTLQNPQKSIGQNLLKNPKQSLNDIADTASLIANALKIRSKLFENFSKRVAKPSPSAIKNPHLRTLSLIISRFELLPNLGSQECGNSRIDKLLARLVSISNGKYEEINKYHLEKDSPFVVKNWQNYALKSAKNALEVIKDPTKPLLSRRFALGIICEGGVPKEIKKALEVQDYLDKPSLHNALQTCLALESCPLDSSQIIDLGEGVGFDGDDYLALAKSTHAKLSPDKWLRIFSDLSDKSERVHKAFVYVLLELEMIDRAQSEIKSSRNSEDMRGVVAYMELKRISKESYPLKMFI
ncbi:hypothetical protein [Helicobacter sp. MIT 01-3238]|uniref:hypothetical protein n=1 Tax=Helicobacter sp. MIT 01-3238 TaxID=398627 RepID=UPI000E1E7463|nr:hypothetical protein [Helicobacter sp. MIT 01-3238]RDU54772.1 hypothetical protein CQA40_02860 [Helicobacter sp. MIT 01-3238]